MATKEFMIDEKKELGFIILLIHKSCTLLGVSYLAVCMPCSIMKPQKCMNPDHSVIEATFTALASLCWNF